MLVRWMLAVPIVAACLVYVKNFDARLWVGLTVLLSALLLRSIVVTVWRRAGGKPLGLMATICLSFTGAAAASLAITSWEASLSLLAFFFTGYISALICGTAAEIVAQVVTWALASRGHSAE